MSAPRYVHGWGRCPVCKRLVACRRGGGAWRHGPRGRPCAGCGRLVLGRRFRMRWNERPFGGV